MKRLLVQWMARRLAKLGQTNPGIYRAIMVVIVGLNALVLDPQITDMVNNEFGDNPWVTRIFHFVSMFVMAVMGPNTKKKEVTPAKTPVQSNGTPPRKRKKFIFF